MSEVEKSQFVKHVLQILIDVSGRKTTQDQAFITVSELVRNLQKKYNFLKHVEIKNTRFLEMQEPVSVMSEINQIGKNDIGKALYDIIKDMNQSLGKEAGHFFIKELKRNIREDYKTTMEDIGLDLGLMQLESEVNEMSKKL